MHGIIDTLLLNATAVSKSFTEKAHHAISEYDAQTTKQAIQMSAMLWSQQKSEIAS